jgi:hypothetical protein
MASPVTIDIARGIEKDRDHRKALDRGRAQRLHTRYAIDGVFDGSGHQDLDLLRRESGGFGLDADLGRRELREHIVLGAAERIDPIGQKHASQRDHDPTKSEREADDCSLGAGGDDGGHFLSSPT